MGIIKNIKAMVGRDEDGFTLGDKLKRLDRGTIGRRARDEEALAIKEKLKRATEREKYAIEGLQNESDRIRKILDEGDPDIENSHELHTRLNEVDGLLSQMGVPTAPYVIPQRTFRDESGLTVEQSDALNNQVNIMMEQIDPEDRPMFDEANYQGRAADRHKDVMEWIKARKDHEEATDLKLSDLVDIEDYDSEGNLTTYYYMESQLADGTARPGNERYKTYTPAIYTDSPAGKAQKKVEENKYMQRSRNEAMDRLKGMYRKKYELIAEKLTSQDPDRLAAIQAEQEELENAIGSQSELASQLYRDYDDQFRTVGKKKAIVTEEEVMSGLRGHPIWNKFPNQNFETLTNVMLQIMHETNAELERTPNANTTALLQQNLDALEAELETLTPTSLRARIGMEGGYSASNMNEAVENRRVAAPYEFEREYESIYDPKLDQLRMYIPYRGEIVER